MMHAYMDRQPKNVTPPATNGDRGIKRDYSSNIIFGFSLT